ncbi:heterokaryon incompatibility protein-domain-containing protein [Xylaria bambusicola]|uniref:heterokaryon incompatibility protein-domain-containing protein n=1 Tax=Xylaria bambusicola TaxID=326684 RepID=UPI002008E5D9|nr:heterokaryon incompatibility protein-domain-containing protein [Xylaria bambusicola]KAI0513268.1 heterokaryon incompatibility protein-domain-containing protein [Xylaria bambusicola]
MRLIDVNTLKLHEFFGDQIPPYAILSHTWEAEEVTYEEWLYAGRQYPRRWGWVYDKKEVRDIKAKSGYDKIVQACAKAQGDRLSWLWVDTNCIDKNSSAELSEAINSMFQWYRKSAVCYAFLVDVHNPDVRACFRNDSEFRKSRWFTRGWTLQELIAPCGVCFYSSSWMPISTKTNIALLIEEICSIPIVVLCKPDAHTSYRAAQKMSWASGRNTTRQEDIAYCLMDLFDVNMPLLYGEGEKAFLRLQIEITRQQPDVRLLAWQQLRSEPRNIFHVLSSTHKSLRAFAPSPKHFFFADGLQIRAQSIPTSLRVDGLEVVVRLPLVKTLSSNFVFAILPYVQTSDNRMVWIPLIHIRGQRYVRVEFPTVTFFAPDIQYEPPVEIILPTHEGHLNSISSKWRVVYKFPEYIDRSDNGLGVTAGSILHCLHIDNDDRQLAFGGLRLAGDDTEVELLFMAKLKGPDGPSIAQWTCRDITDWPVSINDYYNSISHRHYDGGHRFAQDLHGDRYRDIAQRLYSQRKAYEKFWDLVEEIKCGKEDKFGGYVVMDDRVYDPTNSKFLSPTPTLRSPNGTPPGPWVTVQIVLPRPKKN